jgi:hypothetical protein
MSISTCEFCNRPALFTVRMSDPEGVLERHVCASHAQQLELPVGTYVLGKSAYSSFAELAAAVAGSDERHREGAAV